MCNVDKDKFVESIEKVKTSIRKLEKPFKFHDLDEFTLTDALNKYDADVRAADMGNATPAEIASNKENIDEIIASNTKAIKHAQHNGEKAMKLKAELIK